MSQGAKEEGVTRAQSCQFKTTSGRLCRRKTNEGTFCWQHSRGVRRRWRALTRNQSVVFVLAIISVIGVAVEITPPIFRWVRQRWAPTFVYFAPSRELIDCERRAFFVNRAGSEDPKNLRILIKDNGNGAVQENLTSRVGLSPALKTQMFPDTFGSNRPAHGMRITRSLLPERSFVPCRT